MITNKKLSIIISFLGLLAITFPAIASRQSPPKVLTSIKPVQLIAQAITEGVTGSEVLLPPGASPHSHSLRPSDARKLRNADVMFWIGPDMEMFLKKMLTNAKSTRSVPLMESKNIKLRHSNEKDHDHEGHHHHGDYDAHIWLSPENALAMAISMSTTLTDIDPANAKRYESNLERFQLSLKKTDARNKKKLAPVLDRPIFVFHDAYGYLKDYYHLNIAGYFTLNPEQQPGARHLAELQHQLKAAGKTCVFREPQFQPTYINRIIDGLDAKVSVLDPLAIDIAVGPDAYPQFINELVDTIVNCLK